MNFIGILEKIEVGREKTFEIFCSKTIWIISTKRFPDSLSKCFLFNLRANISDLAKWPYVVTQYGFLEVFLEYAKSIKGIRLHIHKFEDAIKHKNGISGHFFDILQSLNLQDVPNVSNNLHENLQNLRKTFKKFAPAARFYIIYGQLYIIMLSKHN